MISIDFGKNWTTLIPDPSNFTINNVNMKPSIGLNNLNEAIVAWQLRPTNLVYNVKVTTFGVNPSLVTLLDTITSTQNQPPRPVVSLDDFGNSIVLWSYLNPGDSKFYPKKALSSDSGFSWSDINFFEDSIPQPSDSDIFIQIVMDKAGSGNAIACWMIQQGANFYIRVARTQDFGTTWSNFQNLDVASSNFIYPQISLDSNGNAIVIWYSTSGGIALTKSSYSSDWGQSWSSANTLNPTSTNSISKGFLDIAMDNSGHAVAVWSEKQGVNFYAYYSTSSNYGHSWSAPLQFPYLSADQLFPKVAMDNNANATVIFQQVITAGTVFEIIAGYSSDYGNSWSFKDLTTANIQNAGRSGGNIIPSIAMAQNPLFYSVAASTIWDDVTPSLNLIGSNIFLGTRTNSLSAYGFKQQISSLLQTELTNKIFINSIDLQGTYKVYKDAALTNLLGSKSVKNQTVEFFDYNVENRPYTYYVTWIDQIGNIQGPILVTIP